MRTLFLLCTLCAVEVFGSGSSTIVSSIVCSVYPCYKGSRPQSKAPPPRIDKTITHRVTFNINQGNRFLGEIVLGLYGRVAPKTVKNFVEIASGRHPKKYQGTQFHRVIQNFMLQGGDVEHKNGVGSWSIYGSRFEDENFLLKHDEPFTLSMANAGKDTNGSQFFITTVVTPWLDGKHTVFGKVLDGQSVVKAIERVPTDHHDKPVTAVFISSVLVEELEPLPV